MSESLVAIHIEPLEEGGYFATSVDLPGLVAQGRTVAETLEIAQDVARKLIESYLEHGDELRYPWRISDPTPVRLPPRPRGGLGWGSRAASMLFR